MKLLLLFAALTAGLVACPSPTLDLAADPERTGSDGQAGPYGVAHQTFRTQARATDVVTYEVSWPARSDGQFDDAAGPCPVVMFVHGGFVAPQQYRWLGTHFASRGYCTVSPQHSLQLAIAESDNASIALDDLTQHPPAVLDGAIGERATIMGHSLGGAVAAFRWIADERFIGLGLLASWPSEGSDLSGQAGRPSLSLIGSQDKQGRATQTATEQAARLPEPTWFGVIDGMNHYDWADGASNSDLASDGVPTRPQTQSRRDALRVIDTWLDAWLRDDASAHAALDAHSFPDVGAAP